MSQQAFVAVPEEKEEALQIHDIPERGGGGSHPGYHGGSLNYVARRAHATGVKDWTIYRLKGEHRKQLPKEPGPLAVFAKSKGTPVYKCTDGTGSRIVPAST